MTDITQAKPGDMHRLGESYPHFHPLDLEDCLSRIERPKLVPSLTMPFYFKYRRWL